MLSKLKIALLKARKEQDALRVSVLGYLLSAIQNKEIALRGKSEEFTEDHIAEVIRKQIKQRKESIEQYESGGRADLADQEKNELSVLQGISSEYLE
ncbi:GatB/YqeY domain-containing protein [candidate division WWE3 bacterium]|jgi:uncharacterized protein|nr:GatB/YqeY domain-containing protein [candidate division WWE3 bacterium]MBT7350741.1 GatB/YqeY domain-containing protein [candidate division WWE3 bacterium]